MFEKFEIDLAKVIQAKKAANKRFEEQELWEITESLLTTLAFLQHHGFTHGMINPYTIFKKGNSWKISSTQSILKEFQKVM